MHVVVLHSDVPPGAPPDEQDTLIQADAVTAALSAAGHRVRRAVFVPNPAVLRAAVGEAGIVFNLVESVWGCAAHADLAPQMLAGLRIPFTGVGAAAMAATQDKLLTKRLLRAAGVPTPAWAEPPHWNGWTEGRWIVKSADEDASIGLDDGSVVKTQAAADGRARDCAARFGGRWFAEAFVEGREFNIAMLEEAGGARVLPIAEMTFFDWQAQRPRIVGYAAKWDAEAPEFARTERHFGGEAAEPEMHRALADLVRTCWAMFGLRGYARVDVRVDPDGRPFVLEINANPCLEPHAGFAASAAQAGYSYDALIDHLVRIAA